MQFLKADLEFTEHCYFNIHEFMELICDLIKSATHPSILGLLLCWLTAVI